jgi:hypothetical protein
VMGLATIGKVVNNATSTVTSTSTSTAAAAAVRFQVHSPSKRRRLSPPVATSSPEVGVQLQTEPPSSQELWKWTLTKDAIAPCRVRDVFALKDNGSRGVLSDLHCYEFGTLEPTCH